MPTATIREYHPTSGAFLGNVTMFDFGKVEAGTHAPVRVFDIVFSGASTINNVKLGLVSSGNTTVNEAPTNISPDGTASNGHFGIETSAVFVPAKTTAPLTRHFAGVNTDGTSSNIYNVVIGTRSSTVSNYIYLDMEKSSTDTTTSNGAYKLFFDSA